MNRLAILAATGVLALMLTACGEDKGSKPAETTTETTVVQPAATTEEAAPAADTSTTTTTTQPDSAQTAE